MLIGSRSPLSARLTETEGVAQKPAPVSPAFVDPAAGNPAVMGQAGNVISAAVNNDKEISPMALPAAPAAGTRIRPTQFANTQGCHISFVA